nr:MAG TPA: tail fiber protein [Caudoviricetes sp.]
MINETKISITYEGDGVTTSFPFPYPYRDAGDIIGYLVDEFESEKKIETNYTYNKEENKYIYPVVGEPIKKPNKIKLIRSTPMQQNVDLPNKMPYISIEKELDWMIMILQEMGYDVEIAKETANAVEAGKAAQIEILTKTNEIKSAVEKLKDKTEETKNDTVGLKENVESLKKDTELIKNTAEQYKKEAKASADKAAELADTFEDFTGATAAKDGSGGKVPKPLKGDQDKYLKASGSWEKINIPEITPRTLWSTFHSYGENMDQELTNAAWNGKGLCSIYYNQLNKILNQPTRYGQLINLPADNDKNSMQFWIEQSEGTLFSRGGNSDKDINSRRFQMFLREGGYVLNDNGFFTIERFIVLQWGKIINSDYGRVTFPVTFPSFVFGIFGERIGASDNTQDISITSYDTSGFNFNLIDVGNYAWFAIGR